MGLSAAPLKGLGLGLVASDGPGGLVAQLPCLLVKWSKPSVAMDLLFDAARRGLVEPVQQVLASQPELLEHHDHWGLTPLHSAALAGAGDVVALLLDLRGGLETPSLSGQTALHFAAREGRCEAVRELIRRKADVGRRTAHGILPPLDPRSLPALEGFGHGFRWLRGLFPAGNRGF